MKQSIEIEAKNEKGDLLGTFELSIEFNRFIEEDTEEVSYEESDDFEYGSEENILLFDDSDEEDMFEESEDFKEETIEEIRLDNSTITLHNVPGIDEITDEEIPVLFDFSSENNIHIMLLEEYKYYVSFEPNKELSKEFLVDLDIFHSLKYKKHILDLFPKTNQGSLSFGSYVGKSFIDIYRNNKPIFEIPLEVRSRKLNYAKEYSAMIGDLSKYAQTLIYEATSPLYHKKFSLDDIGDKVSYEEFMLLEYLFKEENLPSTIEYLSRNLYSALTDIKEEVHTSFASNISPNDLIDVFSNSENLEKSTDTNSIWYKQTKGYVPLRINETKYIDDIDVPENRFYKSFLESVEDLIIRLSEEFKQGYIHDQLSIYKETIRAYLSQSYFKDIGMMDYVPLNSQLLQKKEGYRDILQYYLMFELGFIFEWDQLTNEFKGNEKKVFRLYEYWCYFELVKILEEMCNQYREFDDVFLLSKDKMSLREGKAQKFNLNINDKKIIIYLYYNKTFNKKNSIFKSYSVEYRPDYSLIIYDGTKRHILHFDAKYKLDIDGESYKKEDIDKMHAYKDAILDSVGAYVLYPGKKDEIYYENDDLISGSVGAFPLNPGDKLENRKELSEFIYKKILALFD